MSSALAHAVPPLPSREREESAPPPRRRPMESAGTRAAADLQFPPLPSRERDESVAPPPRRRPMESAGVRAAADLQFPLSPCGRGRGEGFRKVTTPFRSRCAHHPHPALSRRGRGKKVRRRRLDGDRWRAQEYELLQTCSSPLSPCGRGRGEGSRKVTTPFRSRCAHHPHPALSHRGRGKKVRRRRRVGDRWRAQEYEPLQTCSSPLSPCGRGPG